MPQAKPKRIAWGESADVYLLPKKRARFGARVVRIERRFIGMPFKRLPEPKGALMHYFTMRLAHLLFPDNIINVRGVITHKRTPTGNLKPTFAEHYSPYYGLPKKARTEMLRIRKLIEGAYKGKFEDSFVRAELTRYDEKMRAMFPQLIETANRLAKAGFLVPHPEINFTVRNGKIVFFEAELTEVSRKDFFPILETISERARQMPKQKARAILLQSLNMICRTELNWRAGVRIKGNTASSLQKTIFDFSDREIITKDEAMGLRSVISALNFSQNKKDATAALSQLRLTAQT